MRLIITMSVAMLLAVAVTEALPPQKSASGDGGNQENEVKSQSKDSTVQSENSASKDASACGEQTADYTGEVSWEVTVDAKTAKTILNVIKKGKGNAAGGKAAGKKNVAITFQTSVGYDKKDLFAIFDKDQSACSAKSGSDDTKESAATDSAKENSQNSDADSASGSKSAESGGSQDSDDDGNTEASKK
ncbi:uncharacterized protein LOC123541881 [Mercenaria mercenaria]|uniref:uncharacterized protein LOC123541881 n=1 Tax=Mercenaria mercenaria TaxID=6596 RepID=UPI00234E9CC0|nr:uncharacterized protein LOC123541881 [Mercenaria mercenaria]